MASINLLLKTLREHHTHSVIPLMAVLAIAVCGCGKSESDPYVGNMHDFSYANRRGTVYGPSAAGGSIRLEDFKGRFVWVDYAAPWCGPCVRQSPIIRGLEKDYGERFVFITMLTSDASARSTATQHTAEQWSRRFGLTPSRVVPSQEGPRTIPQHVVFSPLGQTLEWRVGLMTDAEIRAVLVKHMREWRRWYAENKDSPSVLLSEIGE